MVEIVWSANASRNLDAIAEYISRGSLYYAIMTVQRIHTAAVRLKTFPRSGRIVPEFQLDFIREIIVGNYRVVYLLSEAKCQMIAVVHSRRDLIKALSVLVE